MSNDKIIKNEKSKLTMSKTRVRFLDEDRIESGSDKQQENENMSNSRRVSSVELKSNSVVSLEEEIIGKQTYDSTSSDALNKDADANNILTFFQVYGSASDFAAHTMQTTEGFIYMTTPPDGGYGWLVLIAAFLTGMVLEGHMLTLGAILPSIEETLNLKKQTTAFIVSMQTTMNYCIGPVSSAFINKIGFQIVALVGVSLCVISLIISSFCTDSISLTIFYGILFGCGNGMTLMVTQVIVAYYFEHYRAIAVSIQSASVGVGVLTYGRLNSYLAYNLGWVNTVRCIAISFFMCYTFCIAFRRIKPKKIGRIVELAPKEDQSVSSLEVRTTRFSSSTDDQIFQKLPFIASINSKLLGNNTSVSKDKIKNSPSGGNSEPKVVINVDPLDRVDIFSPQNPDYNKTENRLDGQIIPGKEKEAKQFNYRLKMSRSVGTPDKLQKVESKTDLCCTCNEKIKDTLRLLFDPSLLKIFEFQLILLATSLYIMAGFTPFLYIPVRSEIPRNYRDWLLSTIGVCNIVLRICFGITAFFARNHVEYICGGFIALGGLTILISSFLPHDIIWLEFLITSLFAFASAALFSLRAIIIINVLGIEKLTNAIGLVSLASGIFGFIGLNATGTLINTFKSTKQAFMMSGILMTLSGMVIASIPKVIKIRKKKREELENIKKVRFNRTT